MHINRFTLLNCDSLSSSFALQLADMRDTVDPRLSSQSLQHAEGGLFTFTFRIHHQYDSVLVSIKALNVLLPSPNPENVKLSDDDILARVFLARSQKNTNPTWLLGIPIAKYASNFVLSARRMFEPRSSIVYARLS